jgi:hypothetical protein
VPDTKLADDKKPHIGEKGTFPRAPRRTPAAKPIVEYPIKTGNESKKALFRRFLFTLYLYLV